jgi:hypothetical protein
MVKSLWAMVQGDPVFMRRVNGWLTIFWIGMIPVSIATGWISSVTYVAALSLWALVSGHWTAWQAARVEVRQEEEAKMLRQDLAEQVAEKAVEKTNLQAGSYPPTKMAGPLSAGTRCPEDGFREEDRGRSPGPTPGRGSLDGPQRIRDRPRNSGNR